MSELRDWKIEIHAFGMTRAQASDLFTTIANRAYEWSDDVDVSMVPLEADDD